MEAPTFSFVDQDGNAVSNETLAGTPYVLYFYPKDDTPGCTKEACGIRDHWSTFGDKGIQVFGVSMDDADSHHKFIDKYGLPFPLLTASQDQLEALGIWKEKNMYGKKFWGINRETYLVGADGQLLKHYKRVQAATHAEQLLKDFEALS